MRLDNINKTYHNKLNDVHVLKDLNFILNTVGLTFIIGKSGSGKTTESGIFRISVCLLFN